MRVNLINNDEDITARDTHDRGGESCPTAVSADIVSLVVDVPLSDRGGLVYWRLRRRTYAERAKSHLHNQI